MKMSEGRALGRKPINEFTNYRTFIKSYIKYRAESGEYSLARFSREVGFGSPNYAGLIVNGKRNLSSKDVYTLTKFFRFNETETRFFELLVRYTDCKNPSQKRFYKAWMEEGRPEKTKATIKPTDIPSLISDTSLPVIMACLTTDEGRTVEQVAKLTGFAVPIAKKGLETLRDQGAIKESDGMFFLKSDMTDAKFGKHFLYEDFQKAQLHRSYLALPRRIKGENKFISNFFLIRPEERDELILKIHDLIESIDSSQALDSDSSLMQLNLQLFYFKDGDENSLPGLPR